MDTSEFASVATVRKLNPYQERMLKLLESQTFKLVEPRFESPIIKTSVSDEQPRHRTTVSKLLPMGLQLVDQRELYTPGLRYFSDGRQRSTARADEWTS